MGLSAGTRLGPYEITAPLGSGGMGEVYRARDTRLDRTVAIKVLPDRLSHNTDLRARLEREARAISSLNHPNICHLYDIGREGNTDYLVMELVDGDTLADRLLRGPVPLPQLLGIAIEIASALEKAHGSGITHRDLKPGNIMLTKTGAKLMDFGLAKESQMSMAAAADTLGATRPSQPLTAAGTLVGTFHYMSPEQLEGTEADARSDIFAFGCVLYEMATGKRPFEGKSQASVVAAVLAAEPAPVSQLQPLTPAPLERVISTCLAKDPGERIQTAHDLKLQLKWISEGGSQSGVSIAAGTQPRPLERLAWTIAFAALVLDAMLAAWAWSHREAQRVVMTTLQLPPSSRLIVNSKNGPPTISPDGAHVAFVVSESGTQAIWIRPLDAPAATRLAGTEGAYSPFWSPDSHWLAFFANGKLRKVEISGGSPQDICAVEDSRGGSWGKDGTIVLTPKGRTSEIYGVSENGGEPAQITKLQKGINSHRWPYFLPDGKHFLYLASPMGSIHANSQIRMASVDGKEDNLVVFASSNPEFADGRLVFVRDGTLLTAPMDVHGKLTGEARAFLDSVAYDSQYSNGAFSVSASGMLLYQRGGGTSQLQWINALGKRGGTLWSPAAYGSLRIAPDDRRVAVSTAVSSGPDIWVLDVTRNNAIRATFETTVPATSASWSPDGREIAYSAANWDTGKLQIYINPADGTGEKRQVRTFDDRDEWCTDWSSDGRFLLFYTLDPETHYDIWAVPVDGGKPISVARGPHDELNGRFSPDGRWVAYVSNESGREQVYLVPFQHGHGKSLVSTQGGNDVVWGRDGKSLYYSSGQDEIWMVRVITRADSVELGTPERLFNVPIRISSNGSFDATLDGRFLVNTPVTGDESVVLVQNWKALLNR